ncbi:MAG: hypothetical protein IIB78_01270 [Proteobacteria bacterium]|nr:hypothetical protein [Pseudomonadota bacterium]MCH8056477.1 hypothetical protein [Pseudomonadota bacterium]
MIRKGLRPGFKIGIDLPADKGAWRRVLPFRRSWIAIVILAIMDIIFIIPLVTTLQQAAYQWSKFDSLSDLVGALFLSAWLLGWLIGPLVMTGILTLLLFGREVLKARPGTVEIFIGLPLMGVTLQYDVAKMRNLRIEHPPNKSGKSWRGSHFAFDYGANTIAVGSAIGSDEVAELASRIQMASGTAVRRGDALPGEVQTKWAANEEDSPALPLAGATGNGSPVTLMSPSTLALIIANLVPVAGMIFLGWNLSDVMVLYWAESAVIGFFNLCKIAVIGHWMALLAGPFFVGHFGGFMSVHFLFIYSLFVKGPQGGNGSGGELADVAQLFVNLWPALAALFVSHAFSFFKNFLGRREYRGRTLKTQMTEPYSRIIFMHLVIIFGGGLTIILGELTPVLLMVIGLKIFFDVRAHLRQRLGSC